MQSHADVRDKSYLVNLENEQRRESGRGVTGQCDTPTETQVNRDKNASNISGNTVSGNDEFNANSSQIVRVRDTIIDAAAMTATTIGEKAKSVAKSFW